MALAAPAPILRAAPGTEVVARGLLNPRGLAFGPDGSLYVAEAGSGGDRLVDIGAPRPHAVGRTGRLSRIAPDGRRVVLVDGLPSRVTAYGEEVGPSGLAFLDDQLYLLTASGGWDVGDPEFNSAIFRVSPEGVLDKVFDYSAWCLEHPNRARLDDPRANVPMGMPFGLAASDGRLYTTDGNWEQVLAVDPATGAASRVADYPRSNRALTGLAVGPDGALYVAEFAVGKVTRVTLEGQISDAATKLRHPIGVAFDPAGRLYVLEFAFKPEPPGRVLRPGPVGQSRPELIATGLVKPTAMTFGPDSALYVAIGGSSLAEDAAPEGQIVRIAVP